MPMVSPWRSLEVTRQDMMLDGVTMVGGLR